VESTSVLSWRTAWTRKTMALLCVLSKLGCELQLRSFDQDRTVTAESIPVVRIGFRRTIYARETSQNASHLSRCDSIELEGNIDIWSPDTTR